MRVRRVDGLASYVTKGDVMARTRLRPCAAGARGVGRRRPEPAGSHAGTTAGASLDTTRPHTLPHGTIAGSPSTKEVS